MAAFLDSSELCIPKREVTIRSNDKIWLDSILGENNRKHDRLRKKYLLIKNDSSKEMYRRRRNLVNNKNKQAKEKVYLSDLKTVNSKLYYKLLICYSKVNARLMTYPLYEILMI
jgi:hypothetical protein